MFDWVHGDTSPGAGIDVTVVQFVRNLVQRLPMQQTMVEVKMQRRPEKYTQQRNHEVNRVIRNRRYSDFSIGVNPVGDGLVGRPETNPRYQTPEHVVAHLVTPEEQLVVPRKPLLVELVLALLATPHIQPPVQAAGNQAEQ